ncbi:protein YrbN [Candidatus Sodalis endolongispinus]|uniref:Protein YrbN n=1 Tax=Candidatus Sodalis endolongispinus TaxID=2812662 RepID=A0ABS5YBQ8_9GAMM|nr:protein YrbN [Candidatus Sodalis endolongispinus]
MRACFFRYKSNLSRFTLLMKMNENFHDKVCRLAAIKK